MPRRSSSKWTAITTKLTPFDVQEARQRLAGLLAFVAPSFCDHTPRARPGAALAVAGGKPPRASWSSAVFDRTCPLGARWRQRLAVGVCYWLFERAIGPIVGRLGDLGRACSQMTMSGAGRQPNRAAQ